MSTRKPLKPTTEAMPTRQNIDRLPTGTSAGRMTQAPADAKDWAKLIVDFAGRKYSYNKPDCRQIIKEARAVARHIPDLMRLNIRPLPPNAPMEYVIENSRPIRRLDDFEDISRWLAGWLLTLIPDKDIREDALEIAISELSQ